SASHLYHRANTDRILGESVYFEGRCHLRARYRNDTSESVVHAQSPIHPTAIPGGRVCQSQQSKFSTSSSRSAVSSGRERLRRSSAIVLITTKTSRPAARPSVSAERLVTRASRRSPPPRRSCTSSATSSIGTSCSTLAASTLSALMPVGRAIA